MKHAALKLSRSIFDDDSSEGEILKSPINGRASQPIGNWDVQRVAKETTSAPKSSVLSSRTWIGDMPHPGQIINYHTVDSMKHDVLPKSDEMFKALDTTSNSVEKNQEVTKTDSSIPVNTIKRMPYAEIEKNAREERLNALAAFKHHIFVQSDTAELTGCENDENDLFNDEWLERDTTSMQMRSSESLKTRTTKSKLRAKAHRQLDEDEVPTKSKSRKCEILQADGQDVTQVKSDILNFQDNLNGLEHPSCELKPGCLRRGPIILPAFDPATEPTQKGIVGLSRFAIPAVSASEVNEACASRLLSHQIFGIEWLWRKYALGQGCILGDDMGMGKTIQIIALMLAIHRKHGNQRDLHEIRHRRSLPTALGYPPPCLVVVPSSVISNWARELDTWGHFLHRCCDGKVAVLAALEEVRSGHLEVMVIGYSQLVLNESDLADVTWSVVIFDEGHELKNCKTDRYQAALNVGKHKRCRMRVTLTGTPIQNKMEELWAILNLITQERFQTFETFNEHFRDPIKMAMSTKYEGVEGIVKRGISSQRELNLMMEDYILKRKKDSLSGEHKLKGKTEWVVLSELTELQRALYAHVISLPDFDNARYAKAMCPIHHHTIRKECCDTYMRPILRASASSTEPTLDPRAVLWHQMHRDGAACRNCPTCISLPIQHKLRSIYNDPALLKCRASDQVSIARTSERPTEDKLAEDKSEYCLDGVEAQEVRTKRSDFLKNCLPEELLESLGGEYREKDTLLYQNGERRSGKMHDLLCLLRRFREEGHKSLVFSESTMMLDLIEIQIRFGGWISLRLDGSTPNKMRKSIVDSFNNDKEIEVLLLSSRAGGVGLNLTGATRVVQFDCNWNPTVDQQAQDRAYRIGQTCPVEVFHLVAKGTLEELIYLRQMYKQSVQRTIEGNTLEQKFEGIQGDPQTYGELFGLENMMQYSKNSLIEELQTQYNEKQGLTTAQTAATEGDADAQIALIASMARRHTEKMRTEKMAVQRVSADVLHGLLQAAPQEGEGSSEVQQILQQVIATSVPNAAPYNPAVLPLTQTEHTPMSARPVNMYDATNGTPRDTTDAEPQTPAPIAAINTPPSRRKLPVNINGNIKTTLNKLS